MSLPRNPADRTDADWDTIVLGRIAVRLMCVGFAAGMPIGGIVTWLVMR